MLSKSQEVFASAHRDIQRLTWNFHIENSTKKNAVANEAAHLLTESCKAGWKDSNSQEEDLFSVR